MRKTPNVKEHLTDDVLRQVVSANNPKNEAKHPLFMA
jgi:hypothetical protein